jgi:hypothetical protein
LVREASTSRSSWLRLGSIMRPLTLPANQATQRSGPDRASTQNPHQVDDELAPVRFLCSQVSASRCARRARAVLSGSATARRGILSAAAAAIIWPTLRKPPCSTFHRHWLPLPTVLFRRGDVARDVAGSFEKSLSDMSGRIAERTQSTIERIVREQPLAVAMAGAAAAFPATRMERETLGPPHLERASQRRPSAVRQLRAKVSAMQKNRGAAV